MSAFTSAVAIQLAVGTVLGTALSVNMSHFGLSFRDPKTRWKAAGVVATFLYTFIVFSDLLLN